MLENFDAPTKDARLMMTKIRLRAAIIGLLILLPVVSGASVSQAGASPNAYVTTKINERSGPGTRYPVIVTVAARSYVTIYGCVKNYTWCEVGYRHTRGWVLSTYLRAYHAGRYMPVREFGRLVRLPVVVFDIRSYWPRYYRNQPFYRDIARWTSPRRPTVTASVFYRPLSAYGSWVWLRGQYVWIPDGVDAGWRPYTEGRWAYTNPYGWTWVSEEPFGWATYHYGRWGFSKRVGWFWVPGTRWAPAWVAWRGSDDYLAWAPLPPARDPSLMVELSIDTLPDYYWQVIPSSDFLSDNVSRQIIRDDQDFVPVLEETRPIGNVTIVNNVVINNVVNIQYIEQKTQETVVINEVASTSRPDQAGKVEGDTLQVLTAASVSSAEPAVSESPPEVKTIEEVGADSQTKEQAGEQPATEELVAPPTAIEPIAPAAEGEPSSPTEPAPADQPPVVEEPAPAEQPPVVEEPAPPPPAAEEPAPAEQPPVAEEPAPPPPPAEEPAPAEQPPVAEEPAPPPPTAEEPAPAEQPPVVEEPAPPPPAEKPAPSCPDGTTLLEDGSCSPPPQ